MRQSFLPLVLLATVLPALGEGRPLPSQDWLIDPSPFTARATVADDGASITLENGLVRRTWRIENGAACVAFDCLATDRSLLRAVRPEARITIDGLDVNVGGLLGQPNHAFVTPAWLETMEADPDALAFVGYAIGTPRERIAWKRVRHHAPDVAWPPRGVGLDLVFEAPGADHPAAGVRVIVRYELSDGVPLMMKSLRVENHTDRIITIDAFRSEILAIVEYASFVGGDPRSFDTPPIHVETDYAFGGGMQAMEAVRRCVRWLPDPDYATQVHYRRQTPCLLDVGPELGPAVRIAPGEAFESFNTFELVFDSADRERRGLALRRMYRTIAPWVTENPLMMHVRFADEASVKAAIDQCAAVGFEMVILTFGSGFDIENDSAEYLAAMASYAAYAADNGIEIGGYSLLASRRIGGGHDVVMPEGVAPQFGNSPCLESDWGQAYFDKLYRFYEQTGFMLLEHDGSYPGDECTSTAHPGHRDHGDSRWSQWRRISEFYAWCRGRGIYLNVPDWYYLAGSSKCGMGYRETNWSLPRAEQVVHTRQNIYDGTWTKTPSMGWMFVPLTQYHGGGAAATIEPLSEHLDHYERMLAGNLGFGVQACWRGPRLFDGPATESLVRRWVDWFKRHRDILESDVVHGRRADGRDVDWMLHVNPNLSTKGMLIVHNPLDRAVERTLQVNLYYTGLDTEAIVTEADGTERRFALDRGYAIEVPVTVEAGGMSWYTIR
ncbi:MAG: hypothetical protein ACYTF9_03705 [Planctomycetota bacterium]|jgi:hypothetical protein